MPDPIHDPFEVTYLARTDFRNTHQRFGIRLKDRFFHQYIFGKTGTGKTTLLETMMKQDIQNGHGFMFLDVHGDSVDRIAEAASRNRKHDLVFLDATDPELQLGYNPIRNVHPEKRSLVASSILQIFETQWRSAWGPKLEHILRMVILSLLELGDKDFSDIPKLLREKEFRQRALTSLRTEQLILFWEKEYPNYKPNDIVPILNKTGAFLSHLPIRRILIDNPKRISLRSIMDKRKIFLVNLSKGSLGNDVSDILGSLLMTSIASAAFSRIDTPEHQRIPFFIYIDEFQNMTDTELMATLLSELRKFKIGLNLANQYLAQMGRDLRNSILGNAGTIITFRLGMQDAKQMAQEFHPNFQPDDFINLANHSIYLKLMIDGKPSKSFSAKTIELP